MNKFLKDALEIENEIILNRRTLHSNPELGFELKNTLKFVEDELVSYGYNVKKCGKAGLTTTIGEGEPVFLLRADMDGLPMFEETGCEYASINGITHSCGHDAHTAMLLGAAKILKKHESELNGTIKFMFQPAEELLQGAKDMVDNGILKAPDVDAAMGQHIMAGEEDNKIGHVYISKGDGSTSADAYTIEVIGKQAHGSTPEKGIDAVIIACHIAIGLQTILAREVSSRESCVILVGKIEGGSTVNTTGGSAELQVSIRTTNEEMRKFANDRVKEIATGIANTYRAGVKIIHTMQAPAVFNNEELVEEFKEYISDIVDEEKIHIVGAMRGTEDFAYVSQEVPAVFIQLGAGAVDEGYEYNNHNPKFNIDESTLATGSAIYCHVAEKYLNNRK